MQQSERCLKLSPIGVGAFVSLMTTLVLSSLISIVVYFTSVSEQMVPLLVNVSGVIAIFAGGSLAGRRASCMGWIHGGLTGMASTVILYVGVSSFSAGIGLLLLLKQLACSFVIGGLGGAFGVNLS